MTSTSALIVAAIQPVLANTAFDAGQGGDGSAGRSASLIWCASTEEFRDRHPSVPEALDHHHPDGCTDLSVYVGDDGLLERAGLEMLPLDDGLVGQPIETALPVLADRITQLLSRDDVSSS